jgi:acetyltransferase EpsM
MKQIVLYGAGGHCYAVVELIKSLGEYNPVEIWDDKPDTSSIIGVPVLKAIEGKTPEFMCITIGDNDIRKEIAGKYSVNYPTFIHRSAVLYPSVSVGRGTVVHPLAVLDADAKIGEHCIINNHATISHNVIIGDYSHIAIQASVAGGVEIGEGALVGAGSIILPNIRIGKWATIGAGAVITKDVPDNTTVIGNPGKIKLRQE